MKTYYMIHAHGALVWCNGDTGTIAAVEPWRMVFERFWTQVAQVALLQLYNIALGLEGLHLCPDGSSDGLVAWSLPCLDCGAGC